MKRTMSLDHWRYRLLHWCFNVDAKTPSDSELPKYLYTHYCPLFHLTNFIALFSWLILTFKAAAAIFRGIAFVLSKVDWGFLKRSINRCIPEKSEKAEKAEKIKRVPSVAEQKRTEWKEIVSMILKNSNYEDFDYLWASIKQNTLFDEDSVKERHSLLVSKIKAARKRSEERKIKMRERILFWTNFSQVFVKIALYAFYAAIALVAGWLIVVFIVPFFQAIYSFFAWLFSIEIMSIVPLLIFTAKSLLVVAVFVGVIMLFYRFSIMRRMGNAAVTGVIAVSPPFVLMWDLFCAPFRWIARGAEVVTEFVQVFYEENCPPIVIIDDDDAAIEEAAE